MSKTISSNRTKGISYFRPGGAFVPGRGIFDWKYVKLIIYIVKWHILNTKSRRRDAISAEPTTRLPFRRWLPARTAAQRCSITVYAPSAASIAESSPSRRKLPNNSGAQKSASPRGVPLF